MISFKQEIGTLIQTEALSLKKFCISLLYGVFPDENSLPTGFLLQIERSTVYVQHPCHIQHVLTWKEFHSWRICKMRFFICVLNPSNHIKFNLLLIWFIQRLTLKGFDAHKSIQQNQLSIQDLLSLNFFLKCSLSQWLSVPDFSSFSHPCCCYLHFPTQIIKMLLYLYISAHCLLTMRWNISEQNLCS